MRTLLFCVVATIGWATTASAAPALCWYDLANHQVRLELHGDPMTLSVDAAGKIRANDAFCTTSTNLKASTTNIDRILITTDFSVVQPFTLLAPEKFVPGRIAEATGASEIEIDVSGVDSLEIRLTAGPDTLTIVPDNGWPMIDIGSDGDPDVQLYDDPTVIRAYGGNDHIDLSACGSDCFWELEIYGGPGNDIIEGGGGSADVYGQAGNDQIYASGLLVGGPGDDLMVAGSAIGATFAQGTAPDGADEMHGTSWATVDYSHRTHAVTATLNNSIADDGEVGEGDTLINVNNAYGGSGDDFLVGDDRANRLRGNDGNDELYGGGGQELLYGGAGNDILVGDDHADRLYGDDGDDVLDGGDGKDLLSGAGGNDQLDGGDKLDTYYGGAGDDVFTNADAYGERIECGDGTDQAELSALDLFFACELL